MGDGGREDGEHAHRDHVGEGVILHGNVRLFGGKYHIRRGWREGHHRRGGADCRRAGAGNTKAGEDGEQCCHEEGTERGR